MAEGEITTAARRIARAHNAYIRSGMYGGFLVFNRDGNGGEWYSANSCPKLTERHVSVSVRDRRLSYREAQDIIDEQTSRSC